MSRKIPVHELAGMLAKTCSINQENAERSIHTFFDLITEGIIAGETVKVKGLGSFSASGNPDNTVEFTPDKSLADIVNAPFALFEPETIDSTISEEDLAQVTSVDEVPTVLEMSVEPEPEAEPENVPVPETTPEPETEPEPEAEPEHDPAPAPVVEPEPIPEKKAAPVQTPTTPVEIEKPVPTATEQPKPQPQKLNPPVFLEEDPEEIAVDEEKKSGGPGFGWGFVIGLISGLALGACGVYLAINYLFPMPDVDRTQPIVEEVELAEETALLTDTVKVTAVVDTVVVSESVTAIPEVVPEKQEPAPQPAVIKDKIRAGYLIHEMAKKHYGNKAFWVYIYEENKSEIGNPNRLQAGLELVIPPAEKYQIDAGNPASIKAANEMAGKILTKYPN